MNVKLYLRNLNDNIFRDRVRRFATQPVTSEEVDEAKSQISNVSEPSAVPTPTTTGDSGTPHHNTFRRISLVVTGLNVLLDHTIIIHPTAHIVAQTFLHTQNYSS